MKKVMTQEELAMDADFMLGLYRALRETMHDYIHDCTEGDEVMVAPLLGATTWLLTELMLDTEVDFNEDFLRSLKETYHAARLARTDLSDNDSVH